MKKKLVFFTLLVITVILVSYSSRGETSLEQSNIYALTNDTTVVTVPCVQAISVCYFILKDTSGTEFPLIQRQYNVKSHATIKMIRNRA